MRLTPSPTELTTAASDAAMAVLSVVLLIVLARAPARAELRKVIWGSVFALLAAGSALGTVAHGLDLSASMRTLLWRPLYLSLGLCVAMFFAGGVNDWRGKSAAEAVLPWAVIAGLALFALTQVSDNFTFFIAYEAIAMVATLVMYLSLWISRRFAGAARMTVGVALTLVAAAIQVTSLSLRIIWPFDHNGLFHLVQMVGIVVIASGVRASIRAESTPDRPAKLQTN
jgi:hypothetical protein